MTEKWFHYTLESGLGLKESYGKNIHHRVKESVFEKNTENTQFTISFNIRRTFSRYLATVS